MAPKRSNESSTRRFDGKEREDKRFSGSFVHKIEEKSGWRLFFIRSYHGCLQQQVRCHSEFVPVREFVPPEFIR